MEREAWTETGSWWHVWVGVSPVQGAQCEIRVVASGRQRVSWAGQAESGVLGEPDGGTKGACRERLSFHHQRGFTMSPGC